jgi:hypothetical protein
VTTLQGVNRGTESEGATHGYATTTAWAAGIVVLAAVVAGVFINVNPGRQAAIAADGPETLATEVL